MIEKRLFYSEHFTVYLLYILSLQYVGIQHFLI